MPDDRPDLGTLIIVARVEDLPEPVTPAERTRCAWCGAEVWLGYAVRIDAPFGTPVCLSCAADRVDPDEPLKVSREVRREIAGWLARRRAN